MNITHIEEGKQLYTLMARDRETGQITLVQHKSSAILTTNHADLICYTAHLITHYGRQVIYTISMVQPVSIEQMNSDMLTELSKFVDIQAAI